MRSCTVSYWVCSSTNDQSRCGLFWSLVGQAIRIFLWFFPEKSPFITNDCWLLYDKSVLTKLFSFLSITQNLVLRHLYNLLGYNQGEKCFTVPPSRIRSLVFFSLLCFHVFVFSFFQSFIFLFLKKILFILQEKRGLPRVYELASSCFGSLFSNGKYFVPNR